MNQELRRTVESADVIDNRIYFLLGTLTFGPLLNRYCSTQALMNKSGVPVSGTKDSPSMSRERPLRGSCNCGRNRYVVVVPEDATERAEVYFDESSESRE